MKTNVQVKDEPVEYQVNKLLRLYGYNLTNQSSTTKPSRTKSIVNQEQEPSTCAWCQKLGIRSFTLRTDNGDSKSLCSEVCFNQYRRASFKKNKGSESDVEFNSLSTASTIKSKSTEKKTRDHQLIESNRRKVLIPHRRPTPKLNIRKRTPSPSSKRHRSSSPPLLPPGPTTLSTSNGRINHADHTSLTPTTNLPVNLTWQPSLLLPPNMPWSSSFQYPFLPPPPPPPPLPSVLPNSSNLFTTLSKGTLSNYTCILPTFIPLPIPIPIPLCFPLSSSSSCTKCSVEVNDQQCQTMDDEETLSQKQTRRLSI